jgi:hypothetical protein
LPAVFGWQAFFCESVREFVAEHFGEYYSLGLFCFYPETPQKAQKFALGRIGFSVRSEWKSLDVGCRLTLEAESDRTVGQRISAQPLSICGKTRRSF